jgi:hypothetical protein
LRSFGVNGFTMINNLPRAIVCVRVHAALTAGAPPRTSHAIDCHLSRVAGMQLGGVSKVQGSRRARSAGDVVTSGMRERLSNFFFTDGQQCGVVDPRSTTRSPCVFAGAPRQLTHCQQHWQQRQWAEKQCCQAPPATAEPPPCEAWCGCDG